MSQTMHPLLQRQLAELGTTLSPAMFASTRKLYESLMQPIDPTQCHETRNCQYGPDERHVLDIFQPPLLAGEAPPIFVFVHGGGFVSGSKGGPDDIFYRNIGRWAARQGYIGVTLNYRLAPQHVYPAGIEDLSQAIIWLRENTQRHGGSATRIVLCGQSAGAVHVAGYVATHCSRNSSPAIAAAVMLSGLYDLTTLAHSDKEAAYFGIDPSEFAQKSPLPALLDTAIPTLFTVAELDPPAFQSQAAQLVMNYFSRHGRWPRMHYLSGHNHASPVLQIGSENDSFEAELRAFIEQSTQTAVAS